HPGRRPTPATVGPSSRRPRGGTPAGWPRAGPGLRHVPTWTRPTSRSLRLADFDALVPELGARDDRLDEGGEPAALGVQPRAHGADRRVVRRDQAPPEGVRQELAAEVLHELLPPPGLQVGPEPLQP